MVLKICILFFFCIIAVWGLPQTCAPSTCAGLNLPTISFPNDWNYHNGPGLDTWTFDMTYTISGVPLYTRWNLVSVTAAGTDTYYSAELQIVNESPNEQEVLGDEPLYAYSLAPISDVIASPNSLNIAFIEYLLTPEIIAGTDTSLPLEAQWYLRFNTVTGNFEFGTETALYALDVIAQLISPPELDGGSGYISQSTGGCAAYVHVPQVIFQGVYRDYIANTNANFTATGAFERTWGNYAQTTAATNVDKIFCQFTDNTQLFLLRFRDAYGNDDLCYNVGTYITEDVGYGISAAGFAAVPKSLFYQPQGKTIRYPMRWNVTVELWEIDIGIIARRSDVDDPVLNFWSGLCDVYGSKSGVCYVTMTGQRGYDATISPPPACSVCPICDTCLTCNSTNPYCAECPDCVCGDCNINHHPDHDGEKRSKGTNINFLFSGMIPPVP